MHFQHSDSIWRDFPELAAGALHVEGIRSDVSVADAVERFQAIARDVLATRAEGELAEIQAWRRTFARMGLKPTQYRCASEALLRRFRKEGDLPSIHPLIDLCNAVSLAFAMPIAVFDVSRISGNLEVTRAGGDEVYATFSGETEHPEPDEVIFRDAEGAPMRADGPTGKAAIRRSTRRPRRPSSSRRRCMKPQRLTWPNSLPHWRKPSPPPGMSARPLCCSAERRRGLPLPHMRVFDARPPVILSQPPGSLQRPTSKGARCCRSLNLPQSSAFNSTPI